MWNILTVNCITNSCIWNTCVTWEGIDYKLSEGETIVSKHVGVWSFLKQLYIGWSHNKIIKDALYRCWNKLIYIWIFRLKFSCSQFFFCHKSSSKFQQHFLLYYTAKVNNFGSAIQQKILFYGITKRCDNVQWNLFLCKSTLHVSGGTHAHHQEYNFNCINSHWYNS